ncbi:glycosyltransferase family 2 protein [Sphingobacterium sp. HJSM2_6]|uniref:glycosyltransferase family 2 protein n=1 Tax=Sphingobacterium sp. HJSM2_6 TaxID=3366264 RepID=UPI003BE7F9F4
MNVDLVITTYNRPDALEMVLMAVSKQTILPFQVIVADDGSTQETASLILQYQAHFPCKLIHVWHEDLGFRAAAIRNLALAQVKSPYVVIIDGDMVLEKHFMEDHLRNAKPNQFLQGGRVLLTDDKTKQLLKKPSYFDPAFLENGVENRLEKRLTAFRSLTLANLFRKDLINKNKVRSCNMSFFMEDIKAVNGFDNRFVGWGREDSEFVERLINHGLKGKLIKFEALAYHLYHPEEPKAALPQNDELLKQTISNQLTRCTDGLSKYLFEN